MNVQGLVPVILALQFAVFGWRISREIALGEEHRKTWLLVSDYLNFISMLAVVVFCIIVPLQTREFSKISVVVIGMASILVVFNPITMAGHYRLFSKTGRIKYAVKGKDVPYVTDQEAIILIASVVCAVLAGCLLGR